MRSKTFITTDANATGLTSLDDFGFVFLGTGIIVDNLKQWGTICNVTEVLKISVNTGVNWSAQCLRVDVSIPSGPGAFRTFCFRRTCLTSVSSIVIGGGVDLSVGGGVLVFCLSKRAYNSFNSLSEKSLLVCSCLFFC